jgi:hypothetical protein
MSVASSSKEPTDSEPVSEEEEDSCHSGVAGQGDKREGTNKNTSQCCCVLVRNTLLVTLFLMVPI